MRTRWYGCKWQPVIWAIYYYSSVKQTEGVIATGTNEVLHICHKGGKGERCRFHVQILTTEKSAGECFRIRSSTPYSGQVEKKKKKKEPFIFQWDAGVINKSQSVHLSLCLSHTHTHTHTHTHSSLWTIDSKFISGSWRQQRLSSDWWRQPAVSARVWECFRSGLASQFSWAEQSPHVAWGDDRVTPDENEKKKGKKKRTHLASGPLHHRNQALILCTNGDSDEEGLVFRITHTRMDCYLLMSPPEWRQASSPRGL